MKKTLLLIVLLSGLFGPLKSFAQLEPYLGQIIAVGFNFAPDGWAKCEGQLLPISQNTALFSLLGTTYGGDGETTFGLPDLRNRVMVGQGQGPGMADIDLGQRDGEATTTLTTGNLPPHSHSISYNSSPNTSDPTNSIPANTSENDREYITAPLDTTMSTTGVTGSNQPVNNMQPYLGMYYIIALEGIYPAHP